MLFALGLHAGAVAVIMTSVHTSPAPEPPMIELAFQIAPDPVPPTRSPTAEPVETTLPSEAPASVPEAADAPPPSTPPTPSPARPQPHRPPHPIVARSVAAPRVPAQSDQSLNAPTTVTTEQRATLEGRVRDAVQAAVHYPAAARMMGLAGRARLRLNYRDGGVDSPSVAQSSGTPMLDQAALKAAQGAHYPATPPELVGHLLPLLVWVEFRNG